MPEVRIIIDGKEVWAREGENLLEIAIKNGFEVPHLCYDPRIKPFGSCRLCFVDIGGPRGPVPACGTAVADGMNVVTDSAELRALRKTALELLMSEHCGDCIAPCQLACPAHIDIQGFIAFINRGEHGKAAELIKEKLPLPSVCGRVCPRFCEQECRRHMVDEPVNICDLKRFAGDYALDIADAWNPPIAADTGKTVAVVGGGPAGLTAAYYLALAGHRVTLYDRGPELGGMLRYGIPAYRLPKDLLDREIGLIAGLCREVHLGEMLGKDFSLEELREKYDAVFLGLGCQVAQGMGLEGEDLPGVYRGIEFLRSVAEGRPPRLGRRVAVVGGGNTAMDAARTALRLGAEEVSVVYRRSRNEMPAQDIEVMEAEEEGIKFYFLTNPVAVIGEQRVEKIECVRMELGEPDESGRRRPVEIKGSNFQIAVDNLIMAIGQTLDQETAACCRLELSGKTLSACNKTGATSMEGVFAAGDAVTGPATVVEAIGAARMAALAMDRYLRGEQIVQEPETFNCSMGSLDELDPVDFADREKKERVAVYHLPAAERKTNFGEYNSGLNEEGARVESGRCLSCGCREVFDCSLRKLAAEYAVDLERLGVEKKRYRINREHQYIEQDPNKCILCASCVRICAEVQGAHALSLVGRGYETIVRPALELPLNEAGCESCGQCVSVCPTGALSAKGPFEKPGPWKDDRVIRTSCVQCGIGCILDLHVVGDKINRVTSPLRQAVNDGNLCVKGAFEYGFVQQPDRLREPLVKKGGILKPVSWEEALAAAAAGLKEARDSFGAESIAVLVSPQLSNEESYLAQELARRVIGTPHLDSTAPAFGGAAIPPGRTPSYEDIAGADYILVVEGNLPEDFPVLACKVRKALDRGARLAVISREGSRLDPLAGTIVPVNSGQTLAALKGLLNCLVRPGEETAFAREELEAAAAALPAALRANPAVIVEVAAGLLSGKSVILVDGSKAGAAELAVLEEIARVAGAERCGILPLFRGGNTRGQLEMGLSPALLPGGRPADRQGKGLAQILKEAARGRIKSLLVLGDDLALDGSFSRPGLFAVVLAAAWREDLAAADVILPAATFAETTGTVVNCEGRVQSLSPAFLPPAGKENREIIAGIAVALEPGCGLDRDDQVQAAVARVLNESLLQGLGQ